MNLPSTSSGPWGWLSRPDGAQSNPELLVVFVHGLLGDATTTWGEIPSWIAEQAGGRVEVFSFGYRAGLFDDCSIQSAATALSTALETFLSGHQDTARHGDDAPLGGPLRKRHLIFVTHSLGGLVVKRMLADSARRTRESLDRASTRCGSSPWMATRLVVNLAAPHAGGSRLLSGIVQPVYHLLCAVMWPLFFVLRQATRGAKSLGRNQAIWELRTNNPALDELEGAFSQAARQFAAKGLPVPRVEDYVGRNDIDIKLDKPALDDDRGALTDDGPRRWRVFEGTHLRLPKSPDDPLIRSIAWEVRRLAATASSEATIAVHTIARLLDLRMSEAQLPLIGLDEQPAPGTQAAAFQRLLGAVGEQSSDPVRWVLTGEMGSGKTTVLRHLAGRLAAEFLSSGEESSPWAFLIPLGQISSGATHGGGPEPRTPAELWARLASYWCKWANALAGRELLDVKWLDSALSSGPLVLILDGVDEFFQNHPGIDLRLFLGFLRWMCHEHRDNARLRITLGVRGGQAGIELLAGGTGRILELTRVSEADAARLFPRYGEVRALLEDEDARALLLSPLILRELAVRMPAAEKLPARLSAGTLLEWVISLRALSVEEAFPAGSRTGGEVLSALTMLGWWFYRDSLGEIDEGDLEKAAAGELENWAAHLKRTDQTHEALRAGLTRLLDPSSRAAILQRTVFVPTGRGSRWRFAHRAWQDLLSARYLAECLRWRHLRELSHIGFTTAHFAATADLLGAEPMTAGLVREAYAAYQATGERFIIGNFGGFLANSHGSIEPGALRMIIASFPRMEAVARHVFLGGLTYRALHGPGEGDASGDDIRAALVEILPEYCRRGGRHGIDAVTASMAWCSMRELARRFGTPHPPNPWPALSEEPASEEGALQMCARKVDGRWEVTPKHRSLQFAWLRVQQMCLTEPRWRAATAAHYLYCCAVARRHGIHIPEIAAELLFILDERSLFGRTYLSPEVLPEIQEIYRLCQRTGRSVAAPTPSTLSQRPTLETPPRRAARQDPVDGRDSRVALFHAPQDAALAAELAKALALIPSAECWSPASLVAGTNRREKIEEQIKAAQVIVLLFSWDFMYDDLCVSVEALAIAGQEAGRQTVVPVHGRNCAFEFSQCSAKGLPLLPADGRTLFAEETRDAVITEVTREIHRVLA